jgi:exodeoxyribonuclease V alpha subunit
VTEETPTVAPDPLDVRRVHRTGGLLRTFNDAGVLAAADVHVAARLTALGDEDDESVALAAALAVRGPRLGHVLVDLATIRDTATVDTEEPVDLSELPWPEADAWVASVAASGLVGEDAPGSLAARPLRLDGSRLYLDRHWREEAQVAGDLRALAAGEPAGVDADVLAEGLRRLFGDARDARQRAAAASAVLRRFAVVAGGPGTGKTTTVARIVALLAEQALAAGEPLPHVALAAPTGKAAARLTESVHHEAAELDVAGEVRELLLGLEARTLHRLLGRRPGTFSRFRHHRGNRLPDDVVIVDETSMVALWLMARLVEAVRPDARLVLVGDPGQLSSVEAGAVLGDVVGTAADELRMRAPARGALAAVTGDDIAASDPPSDTPVGDGIVLLDRVHRFGTGIADLATAVRAGEADAVLELLAGDQQGTLLATPDITWIEADVAEAPASILAPVRADAVAAGRAVLGAALAGDGRAALEELGRHRVLCAHRRGPYGVATWMPRVEQWLAEDVAGFDASGRWYTGRPLLVTENDYELRLFNGDTGVVVRRGERVIAAFERGEVSPTRLGAVDTVYAMTVHKSQGSQFDAVAVLLPGPDSPILTRELLYTAITRAQRRLVVVGTREAIATAVERPVARASGLGDRLWG